MPKSPPSTAEFPRVVPIRTPTPPDLSRGVESADRASEPAAAPEWLADERPTQRAGPSVPAAPVVAAPQDVPVLTVLLGLHAGQVFTLDRDETILGRGREAHVDIDDVGVSRRHARVVRTDAGRYLLEDLGSANGTFVNGRKVHRVELASGDRVQAGPGLVLRFRLVAADEEALAHKLYEGSTRDALTGLYNRKYAGERLATEFAYAQRHGTLLGLVLFDLDHFKRVNDSFGHLAGDGVLRVVAAQVKTTIRSEDVLARYGGEEFVVLVRGIEHRNVGVLAERIRSGVERLSIPWESRTLKMTVSVGVASLSECRPASVDALVAVADERLYRAKAQGRNRVC